MTQFHKMLPDRPRYFPDELIKPEEAVDAFYRRAGGGLLNEDRKFVMYKFVIWLNENHLVIIKDPTR